ncbi:hypothetical protein RRG08_056631 [Elysia crispata]|uniref:Uncharacterized protein n=1 Tax=Elysia crispata TaxID=231223 RepID=A0AAE1D8F1_9GAST|nr:hypothetical protein RRG08_056631 [Elysia crispata]
MGHFVRVRVRSPGIVPPPGPRQLNSPNQLVARWQQALSYIKLLIGPSCDNTASCTSTRKPFVEHAGKITIWSSRVIQLPPRNHSPTVLSQNLSQPSCSQGICAVGPLQHGDAAVLPCRAPRVESSTDSPSQNLSQPSCSQGICAVGPLQHGDAAVLPCLHLEESFTDSSSQNLSQPSYSQGICAVGPLQHGGDACCVAVLHLE